MPKKKKATPKKSNAGRPTDYSLEVLEKTKKYLAQTVDVNDSEGFEVKLPTVEGLALYLDVHRDTIYEWKGKHKEFSDTLERLSAMQKERLVNNALGNKYNANIARLILSTNHGMNEKTVNTNINVDVEDESDIDDVLKSNGLI